MNMNFKFNRVTYIVIFCVGVVLTLFAIHSMHRIADAKSMVNSFSSRMSGSPSGRMLGGAMERSASQYDTKVRLCLIGGIILTIGGGYMAFVRLRRE